MTTRTQTTRAPWRQAAYAAVGLLAFFVLAFGLSAQDAGKKEADKAVKPAVDQGKEGKERIKPVVDDKDAKVADVEALAGLKRRIRAAGYTLPSNIEDPVEDGKVVPVVFRDFGKRKILGGTVYYVVLERLGTEGDVWGVGLDNFDQLFVEGRNFEGRHSPTLDTKARFLYLYQVVNDRGLRPQAEEKAGKIRTVADPQKEAAGFSQPVEVASFSLRLQVDPRYITSWGYFHGKGLVRTIDVPARLLAKEGALPAADADVPTKTSMAVSPFTSMVQPLPAGQRYRPRCPSYPLSLLMPNYALGDATANIGPQSKIFVAMQDRESNLNQKLKGGADVIRTVATGQMQVIDNMLKAAQGAKIPEYVQLMYFGGQDRLVDGAAATGIPEDELAWAVFRADWKNENLINHGQHSVMFGFTTDLPPMTDAIRIDDLPSALLDRGLRQFATGVTPAVAAGAGAAGAGVGAGAAGVGAGGVAPAVGAEGGVVGAAGAAGAAEGLAFAAGMGNGATPAPPPPAAPGGAMLPGGLFGTIGGQQGGFGGGFGGTPLGAIARANPGTGGMGGGFGGNGQGDGQGDGQGQQDQSGRAAQAGLVNVNVNVTQANQQSQAQSQQQKQQQQQTQSGGACCPPGNVIPAPGSVLLGLLGLPGLILFWRRSKAAPVAEDAAE